MSVTYRLITEVTLGPKPMILKLQTTLDLRNPVFSFLNRVIFDLGKMYAINLKNVRLYTLTINGDS
jgi:hypothetical protein